MGKTKKLLVYDHQAMTTGSESIEFKNIRSVLLEFPFICPVFSQGKQNTMIETVLEEYSQTSGQPKKRKETGCIWYPSSLCTLLVLPEVPFLVINSCYDNIQTVRIPLTLILNG